MGFFSDNEINFSSQNSRILDRFLKLTDRTDIAYLEAKKFMEEKNATSVTDNLNSEFAGRLAELYYKGVKEAIKEIDPVYQDRTAGDDPFRRRGTAREAGDRAFPPEHRQDSIYPG